MRKLRLLLFEECNRSCSGCCNKDWDLKSLEVEQNFLGYDIIMLTGGEPMLKPQVVLKTIKKIRSQCLSKIYVYTAKVDDVKQALSVLNVCDGMTVTLHEQKDVAFWTRFAHVAPTRNKSLRVNIFEGVDAPVIKGWIRKENMVWIKDCPLPQDEILKRL